MLPNLAIIGAPKCGTSSVYRWLCAHPGVAGSVRKETFYLMDEGHPLKAAIGYAEHGIEGYARLFTDRPDASVRLEATTHYLYQTTAREVLSTLPTSPRILVLLREPARRAYSSFRFSRDTLGMLPRSVRFREYLQGVNSAEGSDSGPLRADDPSHYVLRHDLLYSRYAQWLEPWIRTWDPDRIRIDLLERVMASPAAYLRDLCAWLALDPTPFDGFTSGRENETVRARAPRIGGLMQSIPGLSKLARALPGARRAYRSVAFAGTAAPTDDDLAAVRELSATYADDNTRLTRMTGLDLSPWAPSRT